MSTAFTVLQSSTTTKPRQHQASTAHPNTCQDSSSPLLHLLSLHSTFKSVTPVKLTLPSRVLWGSELCVNVYPCSSYTGFRTPLLHGCALPTELSLQLKYQLSLSSVSTPLQVNSIIPQSSAILQMLTKSICHVDYYKQRKRMQDSKKVFAPSTPHTSPIHPGRKCIVLYTVCYFQTQQSSLLKSLSCLRK